MGVAVVVLMALAPASLGTTFAPPYSTSKAVAGSSSYANCGSAGGSPAKWVKTSGLISGSAKAAFTACPNWYGEPQGQSGKWVTVTIPFTVTTAGFYNATLNFKWAFADSMSLFASSSCPTAINYTSGYNYVTCYQDAYWDAFLYTMIWDTTNSTVASASFNEWGAQNYSYSSTYSDCYYGSCSSGTTASVCNFAPYWYQGPGYDYGSACYAPGSQSGTASLWSNSTSWTGYYGTNNTLLTTHKYQLLVFAEFYGAVFDVGSNYGYTGSTYFSSSFNPAGASASVSVAAIPTSGGFTATSVTVTKVV